ncbi:hypothetical protein D6745_00290 [Candidatus Woesearchaeota archaeon]|nr:MAG: hypothetical protein D6745_00290 [Candidatus Woesearchaeota archaeon]
MAKKKELGDAEKEIKSYLKTNKLVLGSKETLKCLRASALEKVFLAANCRQDVSEEISHLAKLSETDVVKMRHIDQEMGALCKKPYSISVIGVKK